MAKRAMVLKEKFGVIEPNDIKITNFTRHALLATFICVSDLSTAWKSNLEFRSAWRTAWECTAPLAIWGEDCQQPVGHLVAGQDVSPSGPQAAEWDRFLPVTRPAARAGALGGRRPHVPTVSGCPRPRNPAASPPSAPSAPSRPSGQCLAWQPRRGRPRRGPFGTTLSHSLNVHYPRARPEGQDLLPDRAKLVR